MPNRTPIIVVSVVALGVAFWGGRKYLYARDHVVTDNAQVDGPLVPMAPKLQATIKAVPVEDNQLVREGDTLLVLDARDLDADVAKAEADLASAMAMTGTSARAGQLASQLNVARANAASADANVASAEVGVRKANADLERIRGLAAKQIVAAQQLDAAQAAADAAAANLEAARRQQAASQAGISVAGAALSGGDARVASARATLDAAKLRRSYAVITAPIGGVVTKRMVDPGALIQPGQTAMILVPSNLVWVTANIKETRLGKIAVGDSVEFTVDSYGSHEFRGSVESLSPATGARFALLPPDNATGNFTKVVQNVPIRIAVAQPIDSLYPLRRGMSVEVTIKTRK